MRATFTAHVINTCAGAIARKRVGYSAFVEKSWSFMEGLCGD